MIDELIKINVSEIWDFDETSGSESDESDESDTDDNGCWIRGSKVIQEPFIENYKKFNSNTGWHDSNSSWPKVMQALSHFSYHITAGQYLLCDLQGGIYKDSAILTGHSHSPHHIHNTFV